MGSNTDLPAQSGTASAADEFEPLDLGKYYNTPGPAGDTRWYANRLVGRLQGHVQMKRVFGPDLMIEICARSAAQGTRHFLHGGNPGIANELAKNLQSMFPRIAIAGTFTPPFRPLEPSEQVALKREMEAARSDIVWVSLSTPTQEEFMAANIDRLPCKIMIGVGDAFDIHTGRVKDGVGWIQEICSVAGPWH